MHTERTVRHHKNAKFDEDGEELDSKRNEWLLMDRYLATKPGSPEARSALNRVLDNRKQRGI